MVVDVEKIMGAVADLDAHFDRDDLREIAQDNNWKVASGATKYCFILPHDDYVVKFCKPARKRNSLGMDECELEARAYESAKKFRVEKALLETRFIGENEHGLKFFVQPRVEMAHCEVSHKLLREFKKKTQTVNDKLIYKVSSSMYYDNTNTLWLKMLVLLYGKKFARSFEEWTKENRVNDLHDANIGYYKNKPVLLDYSGFGSW